MFEEIFPEINLNSLMETVNDRRYDGDLFHDLGRVELEEMWIKCCAGVTQLYIGMTTSGDDWTQYANFNGEDVKEYSIHIEDGLTPADMCLATIQDIQEAIQFISAALDLHYSGRWQQPINEMETNSE